MISRFRALVPAAALLLIGGAVGCAANASDDGAEVLDSNLDFYSESARE